MYGGVFARQRGLRACNMCAHDVNAFSRLVEHPHNAVSGVQCVDAGDGRALFVGLRRRPKHDAERQGLLLRLDRHHDAGLLCRHESHRTRLLLLGRTRYFSQNQRGLQPINLDACVGFHVQRRPRQQPMTQERVDSDACVFDSASDTGTIQAHLTARPQKPRCRQLIRN